MRSSLRRLSIISLLVLVACFSLLTTSTGIAQVKQNPVPTAQQKKVKKLEDKIRRQNIIIFNLRDEFYSLQAMVQQDVLQQVSVMDADGLWPVVSNIGIRLADFGGYHVAVEEKITDDGTFETFSFTQARYFPTLN